MHLVLHSERKFLADVSQVYNGCSLEMLCHNAHKSFSPLLITCRLLTIVFIIFSPRVLWRSNQSHKWGRRISIESDVFTGVCDVSSFNQMRTGNICIVMMSVPSSRTKTWCMPFIVSTMQRAHHQKTWSFHWPRFASISILKLQQARELKIWPLRIHRPHHRSGSTNGSVKCILKPSRNTGMFLMSTSSVTHPGLSRLPFPGHDNTLFREYVYATIDRHILYLLKKTW